MTLRGFGFTYDIATGRNRPFYYDENGVKHYLDEQPDSLNELSGDSGQLPPPRNPTMDKTIEQQARELLAIEAENGGWPRWAAALREGRTDSIDGLSIRAISRALTRPAPSDEEVVETLRHIAAIAHDGFLGGLTVETAMVGIRRLSLSAWDNSGSTKQRTARVVAAMLAAAPEPGEG